MKIELSGLDEARMRKLGAAIADVLHLGDAILLNGPLGSGKTLMASEIVRQRMPAAEVSSPTFAIVNIYDSAEGEHITHVDTYRLSSAAEYLDLGLLETAEDTISIIEWGELVRDCYPAALTIDIRLSNASKSTASSDLRDVSIHGPDPTWAHRNNDILAQLD